MADDDDILSQRIVRAARPPSMGSAMIAGSANRMPAAAVRNTTIVDDNKNVRRRWQPGDPWSNKFYFGGGED